MSKPKFIFLILLSFMFSQCREVSNLAPEEKKVIRELSVSEKDLVQADNKFGLKLFREVNREDKNKNIFLSPLSILMALGMTMNGANGKTYNDMQSTLEFSGMTQQQINESYKNLIELLKSIDSKVIFQLANSIWYRLGSTFENEFFSNCKQYFNAEVSGLDFSKSDASTVINSWVDKNTNSKIKEIVDKVISPETVMFLINAIYFKGSWTKTFDEKLTKDDWFYKEDNSKLPIKMMHQTGRYNYLSNSDFQAIDLPYGNGGFSMTIFLPKSNITIDALIEKFTQENWNTWLGSFQRDSGNISLPRFKLEYEILLNDALSALGMGVAFTPQADFTKMDQHGGLMISKVKHKSFVEVNEEGTEAAAVTVVEIIKTSIGDEFNMYVNRPFIFVIRENHSQTIMFIGKAYEIKT